MADVDHTFVVSAPPDQAQQMFEEEIVPELNRNYGFCLHADESGALLLTDNDTDPATDPAMYSGLRALTARRLHVEFTASNAGTDVRVHGHAERRLVEAIGQLGSPSHWPNVRNLDGAPIEGDEPPGEG
jgi:hypothetical protein